MGTLIWHESGGDQFFSNLSNYLQSLSYQIPVRLGAHMSQPEDFIGQRTVASGHHQSVLPQFGIKFRPGYPLRDFDRCDRGCGNGGWRGEKRQPHFHYALAAKLGDIFVAFEAVGKPLL